MKIAIMQPYAFPYLGYFQLINAVDKFIVFDDVNYINKGWINRNNILLNNAPHLFTIPLIKASQNKLIKEIEMQAREAWAVKLTSTIEQAYKKAPFFDEIFSPIQNLLDFECKSIAHFNLNAITEISNLLDIQTDIEPSSSIYNNTQLKGEERILDICLQEKANTYVNPIGGLGLYPQEKFDAKAIQLDFIQMNSIDYKQFNSGHVPNLSIIDVLMFNGKSGTQDLLLNYSIVNQKEQIQQ